MAWNVEKFGTTMDGLGEETGVRVVNEYGEVICDNETYYPQELDPQHAHLIAAAPELLEALRGLLDMCDHWSITGGNIDFAIAAIAKAEGRT